MAQDDLRNAYCAILGVDPTAELSEIQRAYRILALRYHPDRNPHDLAAAKQFKAVEEAYEALSEPERHRQIGAFHTPWSMFLTTRCHSKSPRNDSVLGNTRICLPLSAISTILYLMVLVMCYFFSLANPGPETNSEYYSNSEFLRVIVVSTSFIYGLTLTIIFLFFARMQ
jgi:hypothetical protein